MAYFIFKKDSDDIESSIYRIAENYSDLNNINIIQSDYKIIEDSQENFDAVKHGIKNIVRYNNDVITFKNKDIDPENRNSDAVFNKETLSQYIEYYKNLIKEFTDNNKNHILFNRWNDYYNQLDGLNLDNITFPLTTSLEQYFKDQNQPSLHPLQIP
jgi:hypothetical protein